MNGRVTEGASLILLRKIVESRCRGWASGRHSERVAIQAEQIDLGLRKQAGIRRAMRSVAGHTAFNLYHLVLVNEWPLFVRVALKANQVLRRRGPQLSGEKPAVRIVAVGALH